MNGVFVWVAQEGYYVGAGDPCFLRSRAALPHRAGDSNLRRAEGDRDAGRRGVAEHIGPQGNQADGVGPRVWLPMSG